MSTTSSLRSDPPEAVPHWKQEANERLAAHRTRHSRKAEGAASLPLDVESNPSRSAQVAARVAERYAKAPSYSELLAQEARAAREAAVRDARLAAEAALVARQKAPEAAPPTKSSPDVAAAVVPPVLPQPVIPKAPRASETAERRSDPFPEAKAEPVESIVGNLIEFPREIVALRRARPRLAEGPLREETAAAAPPLRIFEVALEAAGATHEVADKMPGWSSIRLDARCGEEREVNPRLPSHPDAPMDTASMEHRLMAGLVDLALASLAFLVFVAVFVACTTHPPTGKPALAAAGAAWVFCCILYQYLFFTFSEATPGMRYARIALCTFSDQDPTRRQRQHRIAAVLLAACTLGMGFAWAWLDDDGLGWHDRLSHTYQRSYR